jgi:hypothetical protein
MFNATKVEPSVNIQEQHIHQEADADELFNKMGGLVVEYAGASSGGSYK